MKTIKSDFIVPLVTWDVFSGVGGSNTDDAIWPCCSLAHEVFLTLTPLCGSPLWVLLGSKTALCDHVILKMIETSLLSSQLFYPQNRLLKLNCFPLTFFFPERVKQKYCWYWAAESVRPFPHMDIVTHVVKIRELWLVEFQHVICHASLPSHGIN